MGEKLFAPTTNTDLETHHPITQKSGQQNALSIWRGTSQHADYYANQGEVPADQ